MANAIHNNLEHDPSVIFTLDQELRIRYCNLAWDRFAAANGGRGLEREAQVGRPVLDAVPAPLKHFFREGYRRVLATGQPWQHCYECSSPTVYRLLQMMVYPDAQEGGVIVVNSVAVERPHETMAPSPAPTDFAYQDSAGLITMCCQCRRTSRVAQREVWDWVPSFLDHAPLTVSHGICPVCVQLIYPDLSDP